MKKEISVLLALVTVSSASIYANDSVDCHSKKSVNTKALTQEVRSASHDERMDTTQVVESRTALPLLMRDYRP